MRIKDTVTVEFTIDTNYGTDDFDVARQNEVLVLADLVEKIATAAKFTAAVRVLGVAREEIQ